MGTNSKTKKVKNVCPHILKIQKKRADEYFSVEVEIQLEKEFDINKLGIIKLSTDEMGFGLDFGDFINGIIYNKTPYYFEFPGGFGSCNKPSFH